MAATVAGAAAKNWRILILVAVLAVAGGFAWQNQPEADPFVERLRREVPVAFVEDASDWVRTSALRDWAYETIDIAAGAELRDRRYFDELSAAEAIEAFDEDRSAVWCGNAAATLRNVYRVLGWDAWTLDVGVPGHFTHVVTLVDLGGPVVVQDPYYGGSFGEVDVRKVVASARAGEPYAWEDGDVEPREVVTADGPTLELMSAADAPSHPTWPASAEVLAAEGLPVQYESVFALPIAVYGGNDALFAELTAQGPTGSPLTADPPGRAGA